MTRYLDAKPFTVPTWEKPPGCEHGWVARGKCVLCGERIANEPENSALRADKKPVS